MEAKYIFVKPREGTMIRHPKSKAIMPSEGFKILLEGKEGKFWQRRINCGDLIIVEE
jgi:hypothetical protein